MRTSRTRGGRAVPAAGPTSLGILLAALALGACQPKVELPAAFSVYGRVAHGAAPPPWEYIDQRHAHVTVDAEHELRVLTWPADALAGGEALTLLAHCRAVLRELLDAEPPPFAALLRTGIAPEQSIRLLVGRAETELLFPIPVRGQQLDSEEMGSFVRFMAHEWVEPAVARGYLLSRDLYANDPHTRWVGDGLAELVSLTAVATIVGPQRAARELAVRIGELERAAAAGKGAVRLCAWRANTGKGEQVAGPGAEDSHHYGAAFALWWLACERGGPATPARFLAGLRRTAAADSAGCAALLAQLTGLDVAAKLERFACREAADVLLEASSKLLGSGAGKR